jgi:hypothetical protein
VVKYVNEFATKKIHGNDNLFDCSVISVSCVVTANTLCAVAIESGNELEN